jgi:predicted phage-related endonuclease
VIDLGADNRLPEILRARADFNDEIKARKADIEAIDTEIKEKIGDAEKALLPGWSITWKEEFRREYVVPASTTRKFRVNARKEKAA